MQVPTAARWVGVAALWTLFGLSSAFQVYLRDGGDTDSLSSTVGVIVVFYWVWALMTPLVLWATGRIQKAGARWWTALVLHVLAAVSIVLLQSFIFAAAMIETYDAAGGVPAAFRRSVVHHGAGDLFTYIAIVGAYYAFDAYRKYRDRELLAARLAHETSELQALLTRARLDALRMQLHPHFFFNTLNTLSALVLKGDQHTAQRVIARLGDLLRVALANSSTQHVSLETELEFADSYLELEQLRLGDRLQVVRDIPPDARRARLPSLILQPLIENAIRHGIAPRSAPGRLHIEARRAGSQLVIRIQDTGAGFGAATTTRGTGVGLQNVRARLAALYDDAASLTIGNAPEGGAVVTLSLPFEGVDAAVHAREPRTVRQVAG